MFDLLRAWLDIAALSDIIADAADLTRAYQAGAKAAMALDPAGKKYVVYLVSLRAPPKTALKMDNVKMGPEHLLRPC